MRSFFAVGIAESSLPGTLTTYPARRGISSCHCLVRTHPSPKIPSILVTSVFPKRVLLVCLRLPLIGFAGEGISFSLNIIRFPSPLRIPRQRTPGQATVPARKPVIKPGVWGWFTAMVNHQRSNSIWAARQVYPGPVRHTADMNQQLNATWRLHTEETWVLGRLNKSGSS